MNNFLYLLHFEQPLAHARHYVGATTDLPSRLLAHAAGRGAKILAHLLSIGVGWDLAALWVAENKRDAFTCEAILKNRRHAPRYCPLCVNSPLVLPLALRYPLINLPSFPGMKVRPCTNTPKPA